MSITSDTDRVGQTGWLPSAIRGRAEANPEQTAMTFVDYPVPQGRVRDLTYRELDVRVRAVGRRLRRSTRPGARAAILCPTGVDYIVGFVACLYSGVIAVPLFAPDSFRRNDRIVRAMDDCGCEVAITTRSARDAVAAMPLSAPVHVLCPEEVEQDPTMPWDPVLPQPGATAYLQYTSGSTRHPTGVRVTHRNMAAGVRQYVSCVRFEVRSTIVSWLPLFHDMGLVVAVIVPLAQGLRVVHMTSLAFVKEPIRWLRLLRDYAGTHVVSPNFGLDFCVDRIPVEQRAELDLSQLSYVGIGAEPVRARSLARFTEAFAPYGFRPSAHAPGYGLAEATLLVTSKVLGERPLICTFDRAELNAGRIRRVGSGDTGGLTMVGCGSAQGQEVRIVDPVTELPAGPDAVGEIWVRGDNVCPGYWGQKERTDEVFGAVLDGEAGWLRTGDLGFFYGGSLFIAGRRKDLIIVDGRNHHPVDIELTVEEAVPAVRRGHVVAFAIDVGDREQVVVAAEVGSHPKVDFGKLRTLVRRAVAAHHDVGVHDVVLLRRGTLPKTSSGKVQRRACREQYQHGTLTLARDGSRPAGNIS